jgi:hypothetical protein
MVVGEVFVDRIFVDGVNRGDRDSLARWFEIVEVVLSGSDQVLQKIFKDYVESIVLKTDRRAEWTQELAGPLLRVRLDAAVGVSWRQQVGGFGLDDADRPPPIMVSAHLYRDEIFLHANRHARDRSSIPLTEPFARLAAQADAATLGLAVAKLLDFLSRTVEENPRHQGEEFMSFAGVADWFPFYAESVSVDIEGVADSYAVSVWPIHKTAPNSSHVSRRPGVPLAVSDWRDGPELGAAVLTALRTAAGS